jgi:acyl-protein synthetase LuxE
MNCEFEDKIFATSTGNFESVALDIFRFQAENNRIYGEFIRALKIEASEVRSLKQVPFLPISFFKSHRVVTGDFEPEIVFESSGTTGSVNSKHLVKRKRLYMRSFMETFRQFYGDPKDWCILGLLPAYLERSASSLVLMVDELIRASAHPSGGFYLYDHESLNRNLLQLEQEGQQTLLIGVSFALLDFSERFNTARRNCVIMETGGMKGRRTEITRMELHNELRAHFNVDTIHSEYGMTELLSQAYSSGKGLFSCPSWMRVMVREDDDPLSVKPAGKGILNIIDLANLYSCSFIATDDIGIVHSDLQFEVQGRMDNSDVRGCSLMVSDM